MYCSENMHLEFLQSSSVFVKYGVGSTSRFFSAHKFCSTHPTFDVGKRGIEFSTSFFHEKPIVHLRRLSRANPRRACVRRDHS